MPGPYDAVWRRYRWLSRGRAAVFFANPLSWFYPGFNHLPIRLVDWGLVAWLVSIYGLSLSLTSFFRCPRCGRNFYRAYALGIFNRRCAHCDLKVYADG
jgi:hypothetical protein